MNQEDEKYLNKDEKELFELFLWFKARAKFMQSESRLEGDAKKIFNAIALMYETLKEGIQTRKKFAEEDERMKQKRLNQKIACKQCGTIDNVRLVGEKKIKGYMYDRYYCSKCQIIFHDDCPKNEDATLKFTDNIIEQAQLIREDGKTHAEKMNLSKEYFAGMQKSRDDLHVAMVKEKAAIENTKNEEKSLLKVTKELRDYLLLLKIKLINWGTKERDIN